MSEVTLWQGDCLELMKDIPDGGVDAIITDPPYEINYTEWDGSLDWATIIEEFDRVTKENANIIIFQGWSSVCNTISCIGVDGT